jgi:NAD(P)-dependent dehydrogenase (short-subunit alcohol dehydrogenase family)
MSSGLHRSGDASLADLTWKDRPWRGLQAYSDTKLHDVLLAFAVARRWPDVLSNTVDPGWVATKMGGPEAPDDLDAGCRTQAWLAVSNDPSAVVTGQYFYHMKTRKPNPAASDVKLQEKLLDACEQISGIALSTQ